MCSLKKRQRLDGLLLLYSVVDSQTFVNLKHWIKVLREVIPSAKIMLVGHKLDLCLKDPTNRQVTQSEAKAFAFQNKMLYSEASGLVYHNVEETFNGLFESKNMIFA